jgi:Zn-dependent peptidase ImmA (M78 family)
VPSPTTVAHIKPDVLRWARESAGFSLRRAADAIGVEKWRLELTEEGGELLTLRQAERAAEVYERPLAALFMPQVPEEDDQEVQFRRLPGTPEPPWGPEVQLAARRVTERQQIALEIYEDLDEAPPWIESSARFIGGQRLSLPEIVRDVLRVDRETQRNWSQDAYAPLRGWRDAVEALGVLVMQEGPVAVDEMRGFASIDPASLPAILLNSKDDPRARAFTLLHELGHVVLSRRGERVGPETERWCDRFAGQVLMPTDWLRDEFEASSGSTLDRIRSVARSFHVTPLAAAVRITHVGLVSEDEGGAAIGWIRARFKTSDEDDGPRGGDYYKNKVARFGPGYLGLVFSALDSQAITLPTATALLDGVKVKNLERLREELDRR